MLNQKKTLNFVNKFSCSVRQKAWIIRTTFKAGDLIEVEYIDQKISLTKLKPFICLGTRRLRLYGHVSDLHDYYDVIAYSKANIGYITLSSFSFMIRKIKL